VKQSVPSTRSRRLRALDESIRAARDPIDAACVRAERAALLVRHGFNDLARDDLAALHRQAFQVSSPRLSAWLQFAEGIASYFGDLANRPVDKLLGAAELAAEAGETRLQALAQAWLAQLAYVRHDLQALVAHARASQGLVGPTNHDPTHHGPRFRLAMVVGMAHDFAGASALAQGWYRTAHRQATLDGDEASLSALLYNMAERRAVRLRHGHLREPEAPVSRTLIGVESVTHYDSAMGSSAWADLTPLLRAQLLVAQGQYAEARELFVQHLPNALGYILAQHGAGMIADLAWCCASQDEPEQARNHAGRAVAQLGERCDIDDRAATHTRLAQIFGRLGDTALQGEHAQCAADCWAEFERQQGEWRDALVAAALEQPPADWLA